MAHLPGKDTFACPNLDNNGPKTKIEALMVLTRSYGAQNVSIEAASSCKFIFSSNKTFTPMLCSSVNIVAISFSCGIFFNETILDVSKEPANIGRAAFLAPETTNSPDNLSPPMIFNFSISFFEL